MKMNDIRDGHYTLAQTYLNSGQYAEAITNFSAAVKIDPDFINAYHGLMLSYFGEYQLEEAEKAAQAALNIDPSYQPALTFLQIIALPPLKRGDLKYAPAENTEPDVRMSVSRENPEPAGEIPRLPHIENTPEQVPTENVEPDVSAPIDSESPELSIDSNKEMERGLVFLNNKQYPQAEAAFKKVIQANPRDAVAHYNLAQTYLEIGAFSDAKREADIVERINPGYQPIRQLQTAINFLSKREKQQRIQKQLIRYLLPLAAVIIVGFITFRYGVFDRLLPEKIPPNLRIDATLKDPTNNNGSIDAEEKGHLELMISNSGSSAKDLEVRIFPNSIGGLKYQSPDRTFNLRKNGFEIIRIPMTADKRVRTRKVPINIQVLDKQQRPLAATDYELSIKSK
ncbi:hypothetical protein C6499_19645 [Candidatus Poribacteria bacterium]|nr:MAG: hypothetical protein C6499_19645 [Candidatus Poribacteria bacterium]